MCLFRWRSGFRFKVGPSYENCKCNGNGLAGFLRVEIIWIFSASDCIDFGTIRNNEQLGRGRVLLVESNWTNVRKETHAVSVRIPHLETDARRDKKDNRLLLHWKRRHILTERCSPKVQTAEESAFRTRGRLPCRNFLRGKCSYPSCNFGHPPVSLSHKSESGCTCGDECWFRSVETDGQSSRKSKKSGVKVSVALWKNSVQFGCVSQYSYRREAIQRKIGKLRSNCTVTFSKGTWHHIKLWERKGASRGVIQQFEPHERSPCDPKCGDRTKETMHQEKHSRGVACDLAKSVCQAQK